MAAQADDPEMVAFDLVLEIAMKVPTLSAKESVFAWSMEMVLTEFASYFGFSDIYTKLRYLSYVMDVATPMADCLMLVYDLLMPVLMKGHSRSTLSHQKNRILGDTKDQIEQVLALVFVNLWSLDESSLSGILEVFKPASGFAAPALEPAVKFYTLLHDILSPEAQNTLCHYFQADVCHAHQLLRKGGLKEENIMVFMYDNVAMHELNPRPGIIVNHPQGDDVYAGVRKALSFFLNNF